MKIQEMPRYNHYWYCEIISNFIKEGEFIPDYIGIRESDPATLELLAKPNKESILHLLADSILNSIIDDEADNMGDEEETIQDKITEFDVYKIKYLNKDSFLKKEGVTENSDGETVDGESTNDLYRKYLNEIYLDDLVPILKVELFTTLFSNRLLMYQLSQSLAEFISELKKSKHSQLLESDGTVLRHSQWPKWLERALFFRENGRCALCSKDLSGTLNVVEEKDLQIDHMVALFDGGSNDITNLQILCSACNLKKINDKRLTTSSHHQVYYGQ